MLQPAPETTGRSRAASIAMPKQAVTTSAALPFDALAAYGSKATVKRGQEIYAESGTADHCYRLVSGSVRLVKLMSDGRRQICEFLVPGDLLGFESQDEHYFSAEAVSDCVLIRYPRRVIETLIVENKAFARQVRQIAARGLQGAYQRMVLLCHKSAQERMAWFLLEMADRADDDDNVIHLPMTRTDIADYLGMVIETVSRVLGQLKQTGAIAQQSLYCIRLLDRGALEEVRGEI